jgi:hypothetical protein
MDIAKGVLVNADITAYILEVLGAPAGARELPTDGTTLRSLMLAEAGFERVFNGRDFTGIKFVVGANCRPKPAGCAQTEPTGAFAVENGTIVARGTPEATGIAISNTSTSLFDSTTATNRSRGSIASLPFHLRITFRSLPKLTFAVHG